MEWIIGKYIGMIQANYVFVDNEQVKHHFDKCRKDLIEAFNLNKSDFIGEHFVVTYFQPKANGPKDFSIPISIISELEILNEKSLRKKRIK